MKPCSWKQLKTPRRFGELFIGLMCLCHFTVLKVKWFQQNGAKQVQQQQQTHPAVPQTRPLPRDPPLPTQPPRHPRHHRPATPTTHPRPHPRPRRPATQHHHRHHQPPRTRTTPQRPPRHHLPNLAPHPPHPLTDIGASSSTSRYGFRLNNQASV